MVFSVWMGEDHCTMIEGTDPPIYADGTPRDGHFECVLRIEKPTFDEALDVYYQWYEQENKNAN